ncbi:MAG: endonuclease/exonuclease/phosphatase family protein [Phycisphaerales bacterium]
MRWTSIGAWLAGVAAVMLVACAGVEKKPGLIEYVAARTAPGIELKLMTFNIRYGTADDGPDSWMFRREYLAEVMRAGDYDVIGMQEALVDQIEYLKTQLPGYASVGVGRDDGAAKGEFSPILYREGRFTLAASGTFWFSETPEQPGSKAWKANLPRICSWAKLVEKASGRAVCVFNLHLDHESAYARERSVELLTARVRQIAVDSPVVVMGDFNTGEGSSPVRYLKGATKRATPADPEGAAAREAPEPLGIIDTFRVVYPDATDVGTFHAFKGGTDGQKIDYILVPPGTIVNSAAIIHASKDGRYPSDHFAVTASVRLTVTGKP